MNHIPIENDTFPIIFSDKQYSLTQAKLIDSNIEKYLVRSNKDFWFSLGEGLFIIPYGKLLIVYKVSSKVRDIFLLNNTIDEIFIYENVVEFLELGLSTAPTAQASSPENNPYYVHAGDSRPFCTELFSGDTFSLMLSLTSDCSLMCSYCYIDGGKEARYMSWETAKNSIDFALEKCIQNKMKNFDLAFHGEGESTLNWDVLCKAVEYYIEKCEKYSFKPNILITTNGILNKNQIDFMKQSGINITISMDCSNEALDKLRPMKSGKSLLIALTKTLENFEAIDYDFSIRSTVSDLNVNDMCDFVRFLSRYKHCKVVHFEPLDIKGRANNYSFDYDFYDRFIDNFDKARLEGDRLGLRVFYSGSRIDKQNKTFCNAIGRNLNFCVGTKGIVSSCYEHMHDDHNNPFLYGRYDNDGFTFLENKYPPLLNKNPLTKECDNCFLASTCSGDCHSKCFSNNIKNEMRCYINREIAKKDLLMISLYNLVKDEQK